MPRLSEEIKKRRKIKGLSQGELAERLGTTQKTVSSWEAGGAEPRGAMLRKLTDVLGTDFMVASIEQSLQSELIQRGLDSIGNVPVSLIPRMTVRASAGNGIDVTSEDVENWVAFGTNWLKRKGIRPESCAALTVQGDSMEPEISDGDLAFIDRGNVSVTPREGVFVFRHLNDVSVKRLRVQPGAGVVVRAVNPQYGQYTIAPNNPEDFQVIGRVFAVTKAMV